MEKTIKKIEESIKNQNANNISIRREDIEDLIFAIGEFKSETIGVALYETKLLHEKLEPEEHSNVDRHFKHIIRTLETGKLNEVERKIVSKILAHVEKNCVEVDGVEEYLWKMLDKGTDME